MSKEKCPWCEKPFEGEEIDAPRDYKGDKICDACYDEKSFLCVLCEETMDDQNITHIIVNIDGAGVPKGFYRIINHPVLSGDWLGININIIPSSVKKVKDLDGDEPDDSADYICEKCSKKVDKRIVRKDVRLPLLRLKEEEEEEEEKSLQLEKPVKVDYHEGNQDDPDPTEALGRRG